MGHAVTYLVNSGSSCPFATVKYLDRSQSISEQIPHDTDIVHFNYEPNETIKTPYLVTIHGNTNEQRLLDKNAVFVSSNHATRYGSASYVYNGMDWDDYGLPDFNSDKTYFHFLAKAAWRVKNVVGAINTIRATKNERIEVLGGRRFNFKMGLRFTFSPRARFHGMVGDKPKNKLIKHSKGLIFPVRWPEPFGLAVIESLYFGCPVFGTPYGSLRELISEDVGYLSTSKRELAVALEHVGQFSRQRCHEYARDTFGSKQMAAAYLGKYQYVLNGNVLNHATPRLINTQKNELLPWHDD